MLAMGFDALKARGSLRVTLSRFNTAAEVDRFLEVLPPLVRSLRPVSTRAQAPHLSLNLTRTFKS